VAGATVEVTSQGFSLENPKEILFYQPGIRASDFVPLAKPGDGFRVKFHIGPNCPLGEHVLRVRTTTALSDAVTLWVSRFPTEYEFEDKIGQNDTSAATRVRPQSFRLAVRREPRLKRGFSAIPRASVRRALRFRRNPATSNITRAPRARNCRRRTFSASRRTRT
jgi:hypothetical protein